jgi:hypothetical protein
MRFATLGNKHPVEREALRLALSEHFALELAP